MSDGYGFSDVECKIILAQIERRARMRKEFLRRRSDPCQHASAQAGYVFDPAVQRFMSLKVSQLEFFQANASTAKFAILAVVLPMTAYGYIIWASRMKTEREIRCGRLRYKDRLFRLC